MKVIVTGASGYLGARVAEAVIQKGSPFNVTELILVDVVKPPIPNNTPSNCRVETFDLDLTLPEAADKLIDSSCDVIFHLAAIVSGHAEVDFDLGMKVNFDVTRALLEAARKKNPSLKFVFTSTAAVFGGNLPTVVNDLTAATPQNTYGTGKAMSELLINDYSRKGFVDGRIVRLPTVSVRAGVANKAVTSFVSGIIREPLNGLESVCPVPAELSIWLTSPGTVVRNIVHAATVSPSALGPWRVVNLPGITVTVGDMLKALTTVADPKVAGLVRFENDDTIARMVSSFPAKFDNSRALSLGFTVDKNFADIIRSYIRDDLKK